MYKIQAKQNYLDNELKDKGTYEVIRKGNTIDLTDGKILRGDIYKVENSRGEVIITRGLADLLEITKKGGKK